MLPVTKYHGCGNDFIILREEDAVGYDLNTLIPAVCDRHTGLGADGLILVRVRPLTMLFYNCDGSRAPMCGNGIRCFAKFCLDEGIIDAKQFDVETLAGIKTVTITSRDPFFAQVAMGQADFSPETVGVSQSGPVLDFPVSAVVFQGDLAVLLQLPVLLLLNFPLGALFLWILAVPALCFLRMDFLVFILPHAYASLSFFKHLHLNML